MAEPSPDDRVKLFAPDGSKVSVPASELETALEAGYTQATAEEIAAEEERKHFQSGTQQTATALEGGARGLTFGLSDAALSGLGADAEAMRKRKEANPGLALGSEVVGGLAPLLYTGGGSGLVQGGIRAAAAPVRGLAAAGLATERAVGGLVGKGVLGRALSVGAGGALEGAVIGAGQAVSDAVLEDVELTADMVVAGAGTGALLGGAAGGVLGGGAALIGKGAKAAGDAGASLFSRGKRELDEVGEAVGGAAVNDAVDTVAARTGGFFDDFTRQQKALRNLEAVQDTEIRSLTQAGTRKEELFSEITDSLDIANKHRAAKAVIAEDRATGAIQRTATVDDATAKVKRLQAEVDSLTKSLDPREASAAKKLKPFVDDTDLRLRKLSAESSEDAAEQTFVALDLLKQKVGKIQDRLGGRGSAKVDGTEFTAGAILRGQYDELAGHLADPGMYGRAARDIQTPDNAAWSKWFDTRDGYRRTFLTHGEGQGGKRVPDGFSQSDVVDPAKAGATIRNMGRPENDLRESLLRENVAAQNELVAQLGRSHQISAKTAKLVSEDDELGKRILAGLDNAKQTASDASAQRQRLDDLRGIPFAEGASRVAATLVDRMSAARAMQGQATSAAGRIGRAVKSAVRGTRRAVTAATKRGKSAARQGAAKSRSERFDTAATDVRGNAGTPEAVAQLGERVAASVGESPATPAIVGAVVRGQQFLLSKLPAPITRASDKQRELDDTQRVAHSEMAKFMRYKEAVDNPMSVVDALERGDLTREAAEALRVVHPKLYQHLRAQVGEEVAAAKERLPRSKLQQLSILFDEPFHFSVEPGFVLAMQRAAAGPAEGSSPQSQQGFIAPSARKAPDTASQMMTNTQRLSQ